MSERKSYDLSKLGSLMALADKQKQVAMEEQIQARRVMAEEYDKLIKEKNISQSYSDENNDEYDLDDDTILNSLDN